MPDTAIAAALQKAGYNEKPWSATEKLACVERELRWRYKVYPRRVEQGNMTDKQAAREISIMESIAADLRALSERERLL